MKKLKTTIAAALLGTVFLAGCANLTPPGAMLATMGDVLRSESAPGSVLLQPVASEVRIGEAVALDVLPRRSGYLYVYHLGSDGKNLTMLFPNAGDSANYVAAPTRLPRATWRMTARGPEGVGYFLAVLSEQPQDPIQQAEALRVGTIRVSGSYAASMAQVRERP